MSVARWEAALPAETKEYLAELLDFRDFVPGTARPTSITVGPPSPPAPSSIERLAAAGAGVAGLMRVDVAERPFPLWLRAGTPDAKAAIRSLGLPAGGVNIPYRPRRILEIGAGAGYRSVALAQASPWAEILTTEPDTAFQRTALLNTLPYRNVTAAFAAVSTDNAKHGFTGRQGDAGYPALARDDAGGISATPLKNFLYGRNWIVFDTVVMTPDAASDHLLRAPWPACVRLIAVETGGAALHQATAERFPEEKFLTVIEGDYVLLHRREPDMTSLPPRPAPVFNAEGLTQSLTFAHVAPDPPGFFPIGPHGFRLHPNASGSPAARVKFSQFCRNFTELHLSLRVALAISAPVRFSVTVTALPDAAEILTASEVLKGGESRAVVLKLARHEGPCEVEFSTEMAEFGDSNAGAWAEILAATLV